MTVLVTGNGHSGTTFMARLLMESGCDFGQGGPPGDWTQGDHAMEHPAIQAAADLLAHGDPAGVQTAVAHMPPFVKSPAIGWFLPEWLAAGLQVEFAIVCHRPIEDTIQSILRLGGGYGGFPIQDDQEARDRLCRQTGRLLTTLWDWRIPLATIFFPAILVADPSPIYTVLKPLLSCSEASFGAAFQRVAHPDWVHIKGAHFPRGNGSSKTI